MAENEAECKLTCYRAQLTHYENDDKYKCNC